MSYYNKYYLGVFWLPERREREIIASLYIDETGKGEIVSLQPLVSDPNKIFIESGNSAKLVLGRIVSHTESRNLSVKLIDVYNTNSTLSNLNKFQYKICDVFISVIDKDNNDAIFNSVFLSSPHLNKWFPKTGIDFDFPGDVSEKFIHNISYESPGDVTFFKNHHYHIYLRTRAKYSVKKKENRKFYLDEEIYLNIVSESDLSLQQAFKIKIFIDQLFSILWNAPTKFNNVEFRSINKKDYKHLGSIIHKEPASLYEDEIKFKDFIIKAQSVFESWFEMEESLDLFIKNFFSVYGEKGVLVENMFLTYVFMLENYHKNRYLKKAKLEKRLVDIFNNSSHSSKIKDIEMYSKKIIITRGYYTHLDESKESKRLNLNELINANKLLEMIIREIFLKELKIIHS